MDVKSKWPHLKEIDIPEASSCDVSLLIGSDCLDIILPTETRCGPRGTPVGIRTKLGWTITGPLLVIFVIPRVSFMRMFARLMKSSTAK